MYTRIFIFPYTVSTAVSMSLCKCAVKMSFVSMFFIWCIFCVEFERVMSAACFCCSTETVAHELVVHYHPGATERPLSEA